METVVNDGNFAEEVLDAEGLVLVDLYAAWCAPCRMLSPHISALAEAYPDLKVCRVDVDEAPETALRYGVTAVPTLLFFRDGRVIETLTVYRTQEALAAVVEELL